MMTDKNNLRGITGGLVIALLSGCPTTANQMCDHMFSVATREGTLAIMIRQWRSQKDCAESASVSGRRENSPEVRKCVMGAQDLNAIETCFNPNHTPKNYKDPAVFQAEIDQYARPAYLMCKSLGEVDCDAISRKCITTPREMCLYWASDPSSTTVPPGTTEDSLTAACNKGNATACDAVVSDLLKNNPKDMATLQKTLGPRERACNGGMTEHCIELSAYYAGGTGVEKNIGTSTEFLAKACEAPDYKPETCEIAAHFYDRMNGQSGVNEYGVKRDPKKAIRYFRRACDYMHGVGKNCGNLAFLMDREGEPRDQVEQIYRKSCEGKDAYSCFFLASFYLESPEPFRNRELGIAATRKACELGEQHACAQLKTLDAQ